MERLSLSQILFATNGRAVGFERPDVGFDRVATDSRTVQPGDVFWAIEGRTHDGHGFVSDALARGAIASVVRHERAAAGRPAVVVDDTCQALGRLAQWYREGRDALVIGITGSVGKTTTREMVHAVLSARFRGTRSPRNFNNHIGVPLSILDIEGGHEFAVLELAASAPGEIRQLAGIAQPEVGVVTAVGVSHLAGFGGYEKILEAKGELVEALPKTGFAVVPGDEPCASRLAARARCRVIRVGEAAENDVRAQRIHVDHDRLEWHVDGTRYRLRATGKHHVRAALTAIAIGREVDMAEYEIAQGLEAFVPAPGRCQAQRIGPWTVIDDTYNANPSSMQAACRALGDWNATSHKLLVAADMLELGNDAAAYHRALGRSAAEAGIDHLLVHGDYARHVVAGAREAGLDGYRIAECENFEAMLAVLDCWLEPGDVVLVKGSRAMRMERVVQWLRERTTSLNKETPASALAPAC
ncbi:MAG TPA: UDP-N-acetylmuramoyl-tripeptide--D-alanyl-D-alanine ligase [Planctomycetaceae bacterium]|nr:UDP-N-acetylmuramoyl-tripeptide--D-alanyl-D-alanine ligase [Planctomycetaceae bacterium]